VSLEDATQRLGAVAQIGAAAVVLESGDHPGAVAEIDLDRHVADQARSRLANRPQVGQREAGDRLVPELVAVAEQLVTPADRQHHGATVNRPRDGVSLGAQHVGCDQALVAVLAAADVDQVRRGPVEFLAQTRRRVVEADPSPLAAPPQEQDVAPVGVDVHLVRVQGQQPQLHHSASKRSTVEPT
jgi:hypothetical protein